MEKSVTGVFFMVTGEKNVAVVEGRFCRGFSRKVGCRTWFFDGEFVVDWW